MTLRIFRLITILAFAALAVWMSLPADIPLLSAAQMQVQSPNFSLALKHLEGGQVDQAAVTAALKDAKADGEECDFLFATLCPDTRRALYVLNVRSAPDTRLVYAASIEGVSLVSKAYWSGSGRWIDGP